MQGHHHMATHLRPELVLVSVVVAALAGYVALDVARRATRASGRGRRTWLVAGALAMGAGIWSMHFIGMLALVLPVGVGYDPALVVLSLLAAMAGAGVAIGVASRPQTTWRSLALSAVVMGLAIAAMHFLGMASMRMAATIVWSVPLLGVSVLIALGASGLALWLVFAAGGEHDRGPARRGVGALALAVAVSGLHYTAMAAASFDGTARTGATSGVDTGTLVALLVIAAAVMFVVLVAGTAADQKKAALSHDLALVAEVVRDITRSGDARERICAAAQRLTGAMVAIVLEPEAGSGTLHPTGTAGLGAAELPPDGFRTGSVAAGVFTAAERVFLPDVSAQAASAGVDGVRSAVWEPIVLDDRVVGVLVVSWRRRVRPGRENTLTLTRLLAAEAAVAIERAELLDRLGRLAGTDDLTGLPNRRRLDDELGRAMSHARRTDTALTVAMLDLDHFKAFNDAHGHLAGDRLLKTAASAWQGVLREEDLIGRWGGEEFLAIIGSCPPAEAEAVAARLRAVLPDGTTCSAGVATWDGEETADGLVERCDRALYAAKADGRDKLVVSAG